MYTSPVRVSLLFLLLLVPLTLEAQRLSPRSDYTHYIDDLRAAKFGLVYVEDGAADGTVFVPRDGTGQVAAEVKQIVALGPRAVPLLIDCLVDNRTSGALFQG